MEGEKAAAKAAEVVGEEPGEEPEERAFLSFLAIFCLVLSFPREGVRFFYEKIRRRMKRKRRKRRKRKKEKERLPVVVM